MENGKKDADQLANDPIKIQFTPEAKKAYTQAASRGANQIKGNQEQIKNLEAYKQEKLVELDRLLEKEIKEKSMSQ